MVFAFATATQARGQGHVSATQCDQQDCRVLVSGVIDAETHRLIVAAAARLHPSARLSVWLNSPGGSLEAGMQIGRLLRSLDATTTVPDFAECSSACVLAFAGGTFRIADGNIGVHRIYLPVPSRQVSPEEVRQRYRDATARIRAYLDEMDISPVLADIMMAVPPDQVRRLTAQEMEDLRLTGLDAAAEEARQLNEARTLGIDRLEYFRRYNRLSLCVREPHRLVACRSEVMRGLR